MPAGPVVLVTGCSEGGIGFYLCTEFASRGCKVYATARRLEAMEALVSHANIERLRLDVTDQANVEEVIKTVVDREGHIDVLVNNAGAACPGPMAEMPMDKITSTFDANVFSIFRMTRTVFPHMASRKSGTIVNIGSIVGETPTPWNGIYCATKASVKSISEILSMELSPFNISVMHVAPGGVRSNVASNALTSFSLVPNSFYTAYLDAILKRMTISQTPSTMPTDVFAKRVVSAALSKNPPGYMVLGDKSFTLKVISLLPRACVLWFMWYVMGGKPKIKVV